LHDNYGSALAAQPGKSQGRPYNNASSQLIVYSACPPFLCSRRPCPGALFYTKTAVKALLKSGVTEYMADNNEELQTRYVQVFKELKASEVGRHRTIELGSGHRVC
jgi:hypothetical protein